jgi:hypothetical protein
MVAVVHTRAASRRIAKIQLIAMKTSHMARIAPRIGPIIWPTSLGWSRWHLMCHRPGGIPQPARVAATGRRLADMIRGGAAAVAAAGGLAGLGYYLVVTGKLTIDTGWGRRVRPLGPFGVQIAAPATTVFDVIAAPYLGRTPRAMSGKLQVLQRGSDMVLAEHYTPVHRGRLTAATLETVTFDRPHRISFRLVRGPVPHIAEEFSLTKHEDTTRLDYSGELGTDYAAVGQWWANRVAAAWEAAVRSSLASIRAEAERRVRPDIASP